MTGTQRNELVRVITQSTLEGWRQFWTQRLEMEFKIPLYMNSRQHNDIFGDFNFNDVTGNGLVGSTCMLVMWNTRQKKTIGGVPGCFQCASAVKNWGKDRNFESFKFPCCTSTAPHPLFNWLPTLPPPYSPFGIFKEVEQYMFHNHTKSIKHMYSSSYNIMILIQRIAWCANFRNSACVCVNIRF